MNARKNDVLKLRGSLNQNEDNLDHLEELLKNHQITFIEGETILGDMKKTITNLQSWRQQHEQSILFEQETRSSKLEVPIQKNNAPLEKIESKFREKMMVANERVKALMESLKRSPKDKDEDHPNWYTTSFQSNNQGNYLKRQVQSMQVEEELKIAALKQVEELDRIANSELTEMDALGAMLDSFSDEIDSLLID